MSGGFCTVDDVRRVFQDKNLTGALSANTNQIVVDAITGQSDWIERASKKFWYDSGGISEDTQGVVASSAETRDDEHSLPTHGGYVDGAYGGHDAYTTTTGTVFDSSPTDAPDPKEQIRAATGDLDDDSTPTYTRIRLERKDVSSVNSLHIANADGGFDDWVASNDYDGGVGFASHAGDDFYVRENSGGVSDLYIDIRSLDDDIFTLSNAVLIDIDYGEDGIPQGVRRGVALIAAAELVTDDEFVAAIPDDGQLTDVETKAERWDSAGREKLSPYLDP